VGRSPCSQGEFLFPSLPLLWEERSPRCRLNLFSIASQPRSAHPHLIEVYFSLNLAPSPAQKGLGTVISSSCPRLRPSLFPLPKGPAVLFLLGKLEIPSPPLLAKSHRMKRLRVSPFLPRAGQAKLSSPPLQRRTPFKTLVPFALSAEVSDPDFIRH